MTISRIPMNCGRFADTLADFLERDVDDATRRGMEAHAQSCADCGPLLADIRALRVEAANLPELAPSRDLWSGIAERIETPVVALNASSTQPATVERRRWRGAWVGLAAAGLVAVTATITYELTTRSFDTRSRASVASSPVPLSSAAPASLVSNQESIEKTYDSEIARLRIVVNQRRTQLDSTTVTVLEKNLKVIDDAIGQCKEALRKDPGSQFLMESLSDALDTKVQLLRTAATMPSKA